MGGYGGYQQSYAPQAYGQGGYPYQGYHMQQAFPYQGNQGYPPQGAGGYGNGPQAYQGGKQYSGYQGQSRCFAGDPVVTWAGCAVLTAWGNWCKSGVLVAWAMHVHSAELCRCSRSAMRSVTPPMPQLRHS